MQTKAISYFLRPVMTDTATPNSNRALPSPEPELAKQLKVRTVEARTPLQKKIKKTRPLTNSFDIERDIIRDH